MRRRYVFHGHVHGVGFRATARDAARPFSITGWVRNEPDGTVLLEAQGEAAEIERFVAELSRRMASRIKSTQFFDIPGAENELGFSIAS